MRYSCHQWPKGSPGGHTSAALCSEYWQLAQCGVEYGVDRSVPPNGTCRIFAIHEVDFPVHGHEVEARSSPATNPGASTLKGAMVVALASR